jgi:hypothetical protein
MWPWRCSHCWSRKLSSSESLVQQSRLPLVHRFDLKSGRQGVSGRALDCAILSFPELTVNRVMIADANAQRKYEDGKALAEALGEIRLEIGRVTQRAIS